MTDVARRVGFWYGRTQHTIYELGKVLSGSWTGNNCVLTGSKKDGDPQWLQLLLIMFMLYMRYLGTVGVENPCSDAYYRVGWSQSFKPFDRLSLLVLWQQLSNAHIVFNSSIYQRCVLD